MRYACGEKEQLIEKIENVLSGCNDVVFAFLYGSFQTSESHRDIDIALYVSDDIQSSSLTVDLQISLARKQDCRRTSSIYESSTAYPKQEICSPCFI